MCTQRNYNLSLLFCVEGLPEIKGNVTSSPPFALSSSPFTYADYSTSLLVNMDMAAVVRDYHSFPDNTLSREMKIKLQEYHGFQDDRMLWNDDPSGTPSYPIC